MQKYETTFENKTICLFSFSVTEGCKPFIIAAYTTNLTVEFHGYSLFQSYAFATKYTTNGTVYCDLCSARHEMLQ